MKTVVIVGVDPASILAGYGIISAEGEKLTFIDAGVISAPAKLDRFQRLAIIGAEFQELLGERAFGAMAIESGFVKRLKGALTLGESRAIPCYLAARAGIPIFEYPPATVKQAVAGHGRADKDQVAMMVQRFLGLKRRPEPDAADALAVAITHARQARAD